ncbi:sigma-54-dependent Fis family transcriptional regulator [candidate division KSB1 bacterium]|nr:sigma-54-dependent Fis family transcriptional regulator [candidate division KSB1 bacterium]
MPDLSSQNETRELERRVFYLNTLLEVAKALHDCRESRDIFSGVLAILVGTFGVGQAAALARHEDGRWHCMSCRGDRLEEKVKAALAEAGPVAFEKVLPALKAKLDHSAKEECFAVALLHANEHVGGAFVLGPRLLNEPYSKADHELLAAIAGYTARALENLRLYEALQDKQAQLRLENLALREAVKNDYSTAAILGKSAAMQRVLQQVRNLGKSDANVLITGETGTGKELIARALHHHSARADGPFLGINCTAIPENLVETEFFGIEAGTATGVKQHAGLFEQAQGGTLFIDEIGDMPAASQAKLLRVLQERTLRRVGGDRELSVNVRVVAATNKNLQDEIAAGRFREDLYYRVAVLELHLPPLRERREDIALLAQHYLKVFEQRLARETAGFAPEVLYALENHDWPGNVRELENEIERLVTLAEPKQHLQFEHLSTKFRRASANTAMRALRPARLREAVDILEREMIAEALAKFHNNKSRVAQALGLSRLGLMQKMDRLGLSTSRSENT